MRVFIPVTRSGLRAMVESGGLGPGPVPGFAVTGALRESYAEGDEEELEYVAMTAAARSALTLLAQADHDEPPRRLVLAVDGEATPGGGDLGAAHVELPQAVPMRDVVAVYADTGEAEDDVAAAVAVLRAGGPHDADEEFLVDACEGHELAWFATQEIGDLLA